MKKLFLVLLLVASSNFAISQERLWKSFSTSDGLPSRYITAIFQDRDGAMWFATDKGVARCDGATISTLDHEDGLPEDFITTIAQDLNGAMYFKTFEKGWAKFEANTCKPVSESDVKFIDSVRTKQPCCAYDIKSNRLTLLNDKESKTQILCVDGGEPFVANCIFEDKEGTIWIGTFGQGAKKMRSDVVTLYSEASGLPSNETNAVFKDSRGRIWIGTTRGVAYIDGGRVVALPTTVSDNEKINAVGFAQQGDTLLIAGLHYLYRLRMDLKNAGSLYAQSPPRVLGGVSAIRLSSKECSDEKSRALWIATFGNGTRRVVNEKSDTFYVGDGMASDMIETIDEGVASLWFASRNAGVSKLQNGTLQTLATKDGLPSNVVYSVYEEIDEEGDTTAWICTSKGLLRWNRSGKKIFAAQDGLSHDAVRFAFRQKSGTLWAVTRKGLCRLDNERQSDERFVAMGSIPIRPKPESSIINFWHDREEDDLWITTSDGVLKIALRQFSPLSQKPVARISKAVVDTIQFLSPSSLGELPHWQNTIAFTFASDSYKEPQNAKFRFRLNGAEKAWSLTSEPKVTYRNLPDGKYEMEVVAINPDGVESGAPARLAFVIEPPIWKSKWAYALYALLLIGALIGVRWTVQNWSIIVEHRKRRHIGHYELKTLLGEGGMGKVYEAIDRRTGQKRAIKVLHSALMSDVENRRRLAHEGQLLREFSHPNIIKIYEVGETKDEGYLVMELLSGGTLKEFIQKRHPLPLATIQRIASQICEGLREIHKRGIVHRDLKTMNIMLDEKGVARIMDFGLSKSPLVSMKTTLGAIIGTLGYAAPEQITGKRIDARTDIFSFGATLYELCANRPPFSGENEMAVIHAIFNQTPTPICDLRPDLPKALEKIVDKCLQNDANLRYQTIEQVREELRNLVPERDSAAVSGKL